LPPDEQPQAEPEASDDLNALIHAAFDEHEALADETPPERARAPYGKFTKATPETEATEAAESAEVAKPEPDKPAAEDKPAASTAEPPPTWKAEDKETFRTLPAAAQQILLKRHHEMEADYTNKTHAIASLRRDYEPVQAILAPYEPQIRARGFTPASLIQAWSNVEVGLANPITAPAIVRDIVNNYRIDKAQLAQILGLSNIPAAPQVADGQQPIVLPPEVRAELETLRNGHQQVTQFLTAQQQQQRQEAEHRVMSTIETFRTATDDKGALLHPHFDELENDMLVLLNAERASGRVPELQDIYDKAVWANTSTREKILTSQRAAEEAQRVQDQKKREEEARAKAERARKASSSVTGAPGSGQARLRQSQDENRSIKDELLAALEEADG